MEASKRLNFLDSLRSFAIFMVIFYHVTFQYVADFFPFVQNNVSDRNSIFYYILSLLFKGEILNSIMFFIAGYFAIPVLLRKGVGHFYRDKLKRLGIPYIIGFIIVVPIMKNIAITSWGYKADDWYLRCFYPENTSPIHFWFIGVLLIFFSILCLAFIIFKDRFTPLKIQAGALKIPFALLFITTVSAVYFAVSLFYPASYFVNLYVVYFQAITIIPYALYFVLGIYAYKRDWFNAGYKPKIIPWSIAYGISIAIYIASVINIGNIFGFINQSLKVALESISLNIAVFSAIMALLALFQKYVNRDSRFLKGISKSSYSAYIIHYLIVYFLIYSMRYIPVPEALRYITQLIAAIALSFGIGYVMNRTPAFVKGIVKSDIRQGL